MTVLFVNWEGPSTRYLESLFLPILAPAVRARGGGLRVLHFGWDLGEREPALRKLCAEAGVALELRPAWRRPVGPGTLASVVRGGVEVAREVRREGVDVVLPRAPICGGMALAARRLAPAFRLLYDADGLMADERADFGGWSRTGAAYRMLRLFEDTAAARADGLIARTAWAVDVLSKRVGEDLLPRAVVVSNGRDEAVFTPGTLEGRQLMRAELGIPDAAPLLVYAGTVGPQYRPAEIMVLLAAVRRLRPDARLLFLTGQPHDAEPYIAAAGVDSGAVTLRRVPPLDIPRYLAAGDVGVALRAPFFSQRAVAPVKTAEYLLCGLPVVASEGIGEDDAVEGVGWLVPEGAGEWAERAAGWLVHEVLPRREAYRERARERGVARFSLARSVREYGRALNLAYPPAA